MNGLTGMVYDYDFLYHYYESTQANEVTHGEKLMGLGRGRIIEMISLHFIYTYVVKLVKIEDE